MFLVNVPAIFLLLSTTFSFTHEWPFSHSETYTDKIYRCIDSLTQAVKFYGDKYRSLTIDSLLGLAILRGWWEFFAIWFLDSIGSICYTKMLPNYIIKRVCGLSMLINNSFDAMRNHILSHKLGFLSMIGWKANIYTGNTIYVSESPTSALIFILNSI